MKITKLLKGQLLIMLLNNFFIATHSNLQQNTSMQNDVKINEIIGEANSDQRIAYLNDNFFTTKLKINPLELSDEDIKKINENEENNAYNFKANGEKFCADTIDQLQKITMFLKNGGNFDHSEKNFIHGIIQKDEERQVAYEQIIEKKSEDKRPVINSLISMADFIIKNLTQKTKETKGNWLEKILSYDLMDIQTLQKFVYNNSDKPIKNFSIKDFLNNPSNDESSKYDLKKRLIHFFQKIITEHESIFLSYIVNLCEKGLDTDSLKIISHFMFGNETSSPDDIIQKIKAYKKKGQDEKEAKMKYEDLIQIISSIELNNENSKNIDNEFKLTVTPRKIGNYEYFVKLKYDKEKKKLIIQKHMLRDNKKTINIRVLNARMCVYHAADIYNLQMVGELMNYTQLLNIITWFNNEGIRTYKQDLLEYKTLLEYKKKLENLTSLNKDDKSLKKENIIQLKNEIINFIYNFRVEGLNIFMDYNYILPVFGKDKNIVLNTKYDLKSNKNVRFDGLINMIAQPEHMIKEIKLQDQEVNIDLIDIIHFKTKQTVEYINQYPEIFFSNEFLSLDVNYTKKVLSIIDFKPFKEGELTSKQLMIFLKNKHKDNIVDFILKILKNQKDISIDWTQYNEILNSKEFLSLSTENAQNVLLIMSSQAFKTGQLTREQLMIFLNNKHKDNIIKFILNRLETNQDVGIDWTQYNDILNSEEFLSLSKEEIQDVLLIIASKHFQEGKFTTEQLMNVLKNPHRYKILGWILELFENTVEINWTKCNEILTSEQVLFFYGQKLKNLLSLISSKTFNQGLFTTEQLINILKNHSNLLQKISNFIKVNDDSVMDFTEYNDILNSKDFSSLTTSFKYKFLDIMFSNKYTKGEITKAELMNLLNLKFNEISIQNLQEDLQTIIDKEISNKIKEIEINLNKSILKIYTQINALINTEEILDINTIIESNKDIINTLIATKQVKNIKDDKSLDNLNKWNDIFQSVQ